MGMDFNSAKIPSGWRVILAAMYNQKYEKSARFLLEHGVDINTVTNSGKTLLFWALKNDLSDEFIRYLLDLEVEKDYESYVYARLYREDLAKELKPELHTNPKAAYAYEKYQFYDDLYDFLNNYNDTIEVFENDNNPNLLELVLDDYLSAYLSYHKKDKKILLKIIKLLILRGMDLNKISKKKKISLNALMLMRLNKFPKEFREFLFINGYLKTNE